jgi:hypothetical protein
MELELCDIPGMTFHISLFISTYFSHGAVITYFSRFTFAQLGIPFFCDVMLVGGLFLTLVSQSLSTRPQVLRVLIPTNSYNAASYNWLVSYRYQ